MMTGRAFLGTTVLILAAMALLAVVETFVPFFRKDWRRRHLAQNLQLTALTLALNFAFNMGAGLVTGWLSSRGFGLLAGAGLSPLTTALVAVVVLDASTYGCHRLMHVLPPLWRAHQVHHSDPLVDVTTALRAHPIETVCRFVFVVTPSWALGLPAESVAIYRAVSVSFALLEHMNVKLWQPLDTALSLVVSTPNVHKLHHSRRPSETDTNYGNIFSVFDRILGTFTPSSRATSVDYGLEGHDDGEFQRLRALLRLPFRRVHPARARPSIA